MEESRKQDETTTLVHWTYTNEEWKNFVRWKKRKKGMLPYLWHLLFPGSDRKAPGITIFEDKVSVNNVHEPFHDDQRLLRRVNIRDAGTMNIMEISYHSPYDARKMPGEITVPVPKGKLREAIQLLETLNATLK